MANFSKKTLIDTMKKITILSLVLAMFSAFVLPLDAVQAQSNEPLSISNVRVVINDTSALVTWDTNRPAEGRINFGLFPGNYHFVVSTNQKTQNQAITLRGLFPETTYFFRLTSFDDNSEVLSFEQQFKTQKLGKSKAPSISGVSAVYMTGTTATIQWQTDEPASSVVEYGHTTSYGSTRSDGRLVRNHDVTITGLEPGAFYHYRVKSKDSDNNTTIYNDLSFRASLTRNSERSELAIFNVKPTSENSLEVTHNSVVISWQTNKLTEGKIRWGARPNPSTVVQASSPRNFFHSITLIGLQPGTEYYFDIESKDVFGRNLKSEGHSFVTKTVNGTVPVNPNTGNPGTVLGASTEGLVVYLPFDEGTGNTAHDLSFNDNNGYLDGVAWANGNFGNALSFNGSDSNVRVNDNAQIRLGDSVSMVAWIKVNSFGQYDKIISKEDAYELLIGPGDGTLRMALYPERSHDWIWLNSSTKPLQPNTWHLVVGTYDGSTMKLYTDNAREVGVNSKSMDINDASYPIYIGGNVVDDREFFDGLIDDVAVFNYALTPEEIQTIYQSGVAKYLEQTGIPTIDVPSPTITPPTGRVLGATNIPPVVTYSPYVCNPDANYTNFKALYRTTASPDVWAILETGQRHYITSPESFAMYECNWDEVRTVSEAKLNSYPIADLVRTPSDPTVYKLFERASRQWLKTNIPSPTVFVSYPKNFWGNVARINHLDIASYPDVRLIKGENNPNVYLIEGSTKRLIANAEVFVREQFEWFEIVTVNDLHLESYSAGADLN